MDQIHGTQAQGMDGDQAAWVSCIPSALIQLETCFDVLSKELEIESSSSTSKASMTHLSD